MRYKYLITLFIVWLFALNVNASSPPVAAAEMLNEIALPDDFAFSQNEACTGHKYFLQATAQENGMFLVCSHYIDPMGRSEETYKRQFIDVYDADGKFYKELTFYSQHPYIVEMINNSVYIYFYSYAITFDLYTDELHCFDIPDSYIANNDSYDHLRLNSFTSGQWQYRCVKSAVGYKQLVRQNGDVHEVVVNLPGMGLNYSLGMICAAVISLVSVVIIVMVYKKHR